MHWSLDLLDQATMELIALDHLEIDFSTFSWLQISFPLFKFADNKDMHNENNILIELEFWPEWTTNNRIRCPQAPIKYPINLVFHFFFFFLLTSELFKIFWWLYLPALRLLISMKTSEIWGKNAEKIREGASYKITHVSAAYCPGVENTVLTRNALPRNNTCTQYPVGIQKN